MGSKGEGSRGGHIVGHTKSGDPIYGAPATKSPQEQGASSAPESTAKRLTKAAAKVVIGAAVTVAGGYAAGGMIRKAAKVANAAHTAEKLGKPAAKTFRIAQKVLHNTEVAVKYGTSTAGAALIGEGASETIKGTKYDKEGNRLKIGVAAASSAAILSRTGFYKNILPGKSSLKKAGQALGMSIKKGPKPIEKPAGKMVQKAFRFKKK